MSTHVDFPAPKLDTSFWGIKSQGKSTLSFCAVKDHVDFDARCTQVHLVLHSDCACFRSCAVKDIAGGCPVQKMEPASDETTELLRLLLAEHYINGNVPPGLVAVVESTLTDLGQWFPDPQQTWLPGFGYM